VRPIGQQGVAGHGGGRESERHVARRYPLRGLDHSAGRSMIGTLAHLVLAVGDPDADGEDRLTCGGTVCWLSVPGFALSNRRGVPPALGSGIPSGTNGIPLNTAQIQKSKTRCLYNRFGTGYRSVRVVYQSVSVVYR
jgi:hypothetical protein